MKGDFTRVTFRPEQHYSGVLMQQGRVQVDADWNEAMGILVYRDRTARRDLIGLCGAPQGEAGFLIEVVDGELRIAPGHYYVDGILVENEAAVTITEQPHLPANTLEEVLVPAGTTLEPGTYLACLDVWERHITALEDPAIREVALGGPDTATRTQVVWQVRLTRAESEENTPLDCASTWPLWDEITAPSSGRLSARAEPGAAETDPCVVPAQAGYRGLENQLYRVEVHRVVSANEITIKWSRENGSVVFRWEDQDPLDPNRLILNSTGRDNVLGVAAGDWVELTDDTRELRGEPGLLVSVVNVEGNVLTVDPGAETVNRADFPLNPKVRRWDMPRDVGEIAVDLTVTDNWIPLENGVEVKLEPGTYRTGDYWLIPARTATRNIEWPQDDAAPPQPLALLPQGIQHHYCRLALLDFDGQAWSVLSDCRPLFPPLTEQIRFFHVGGDGQEAMPRQFLPQPLQVGVSNGQRPVTGARVAFEIVEGNGRLRAPGMGLAKRLVVETDAQGVAQCEWRLDAPTRSQRVRATLLEIDGKPFVDAGGTPRLTELFFNANQSRADNVAYDSRRCPDLKEATTIQQAIDILCRRPQGGGCGVTVGKGGTFERLDEAIAALLERGEREICLCLLAGEHETVSPSITLPLEERDLHITIHGCGAASRLTLEEKPWLFRGVRSVTLRDLSIEPAFQVNNVEGAISFRHCAQVTVTGCTVRGFTPEGPLMSIADADQVRLRDNLLEASHFASLEVPRDLFTKAQVNVLADVCALPTQGEFRRAAFREKAVEAAHVLAGMSAEERRQAGKQIQEAIQGLRQRITAGEGLALLKLVVTLAAEEVSPANILDLLLDIQRAAIKARPGLALVLGETFSPRQLPEVELGTLDDDDLISLESNEIAGVVSLYGLPAPHDFLEEALNKTVLDVLQSALKAGQVQLSGRLGTLHLRGNQMVQVTVAREAITALQQALSLSGEQGGKVPVVLLSRTLVSGNIFEAGHNVFVARHVNMGANEFKMTAAVRPRPSPDDLAAQPALDAGLIIADSTIYTGNHSQDNAVVLRNISRTSAQAANLEITIG